MKFTIGATVGALTALALWAGLILAGWAAIAWVVVSVFKAVMS